MKHLACLVLAAICLTSNAATVRTASETFVTNKIEEAISAIPAPDFSTNNTTLVATIEAKAPAPGDYATVSNRAMTALQSYTESDPTISAWAKAAQKPSYTASEVGALPAEWKSDQLEVPNSKRISFFGDVYFNEYVNCEEGVGFGYGSGGIFPDSPNVFAFDFTGKTPGTYTNITSRLVPDGSNVATSNLLVTAMQKIFSTVRQMGVSTFTNDVGYLVGEHNTLTNNAAFRSAVAAVSPPTDTSELEARGFVRIVSDDEIYFVTITTTED